MDLGSALNVVAAALGVVGSTLAILQARCPRPVNREREADHGGEEAGDGRAEGGI
jgi:hypothetical protein